MQSGASFAGPSYVWLVTQERWNAATLYHVQGPTLSIRSTKHEHVHGTRCARLRGLLCSVSLTILSCWQCEVRSDSMK